MIALLVVEMINGSSEDDNVDEVSVGTMEPIRALYLWSEYYRILDTPSEQAHFFDVCEVEGVDTVYLPIDEDIIWVFDTYPERIVTFIQNAQDRGIRTEALLSDGTGRVLNGPESHAVFVGEVVRYNIQNPQQAFTGFHWDIENSAGYWTTEEFVRAYSDYLTEVMSWSFNGTTVNDQGLTLSFTAGSNWIHEASFSDLVQQTTYVVCGNYGGSFEDLIDHQSALADYCDERQIPWISGLQSDETGSAYTLYGLGKDAFHDIMSQLDTYYKDNYDYFSGFALHYYSRSISTWNSITAVDWPSGTYQSGDTLSVPVTIQTSDNKGYKYRGVRLEVRDQDENIHTTSKILLLDRRETRTVSMEWQVPPEAPSGGYDVRVTVYDLDTIYEGSRDPLYYIWDDFVVDYALMAKEVVEDQLSLDDFVQLLQDNPDIFYGHGRVDPLYTDYKGWEEDLFSVS
jgi:hypothetical protein